jgi:hypothetical protein
VIIVFTEFLKYAVMPYFDKKDIYVGCLHAKETFKEDHLFKKQLYNLKLV